MARISQSELDRLKTDIDLVRLIESQGYQLQQHGKDQAILCPFHDDKNPSLIISPQKNVFNCFGCGERGTVIDWVMKTQAVSFKHAVEILRDGGQLASADKKIPKRGRAKKLDGPFNQTHEDQALLNQVNDYYHQTLKQSPEALAYLKKRGLDHPELIDTFKLGFCNRSLGYRLLSRDSVAGKAQRQQLIEIGLLRSSGHEHFNGCITFPVIDDNHNITELYGRKIGGHLVKGTPLHLYLPGAHQGIFNFMAMDGRYTGAPGESAAVSDGKEIILCESIIDALTFWCNGFRNVTSSYGSNGFTDELLTAFKQHSIKRVLIAYDRDDAGNDAATKLAKTLNQNNIDCYRIQFPKGMDANEYALQVTPAQKSLSLVIRKAEWLGYGKPKSNITSNPIKNDTPIDETIEDNVHGCTNVAGAGSAGATKDVVSDLSVEIPEPENVSPQPKAPENNINADITDNEIKFTFSNRHYRVRGFNKNLTYDQLKINLLVRKDDDFDAQGSASVAGDRMLGAIHSDILDLYSAKHRAAFIKQASIELGVDSDLIKKDLGQLLLKLEALQEEQIKQSQTLKNETVELSDAEHNAAIDLLKDKNLLKRILTDFNTCGVIGEETNKLVGYLACVSRKLDKPLAVIIQSSSAAGKSSLMDAILNLMPNEERIQYSAMTGQSLFYMGETDLKHKILAIAEEEGAENASYALKLLQSEGEITIASTGKDDATGNLVTKEYKVEGPVMLFLTTTAIDIDEELMNRCLVLTVNETREHTQAIHEQQRFDETLEGLLAGEQKNELIALHRNAQRLLKPLKVVNPFAKHLTFLNDKTRTRRDHKKYLMLIRSIALLHQYQRDIKTVTHQGKPVEYIEVTLNDIEVANQLAHDVLGRTLDELPPQTRRLLKLIRQFVYNESEVHRMDPGEVRFSRKDIRDYTGWSDGQLKIHCARLTDLEYLLVHQGGRGKAIRYELLYDGDIDHTSPHLIGLIDPKTLHDSEKLGQNRQKSAPSQGQVRPKLGPSQTSKKADKQNINNHLSRLPVENPKNARLEEKTNRSHNVVG